MKGSSRYSQRKTGLCTREEMEEMKKQHAMELQEQRNLVKQFLDFYNLQQVTTDAARKKMRMKMAGERKKISDHPIEAMAVKCYTRNIYEIFKKEWKASGDCGHEKISKVNDLVKYSVGFLKGNKEQWKTVEYKVGSDFFATCSCARFETCGILCKHILYIMKRKLLTSIPDHYILPRWTMKATYNVRSIGTRLSGGNDNATKHVSFMTLWSIRSMFNKVLEGVRDSPSEIEKLIDFLMIVLTSYKNKVRFRNFHGFEEKKNDKVWLLWRKRSQHYRMPNEKDG